MAEVIIQKVAGCDEGLVAALVELHRRAFPPHLRIDDPAAYFREALGDEHNLNIVMYDRDGAVIGYLRGIPQAKVCEELRSWDPRMKDDPDRLYLDIILVRPDQRGRNHALRLFRAICAEAEKRGLYKLSMHARTTTGLNDYLHRIFAESRFLRRIEDWYGSGEPFDYLETTTRLRVDAMPNPSGGPRPNDRVAAGKKQRSEE